MSQENETTDTILCLSLNESRTEIAVGTLVGFYVFTVGDQLERKYFQKIGGIGVAELLGNSEILLVGGGSHPFMSDSEIVVYDMNTNKVIKEKQRHYNRPIRNCRATSSDIFIASDQTIDVFKTLTSVPQIFDTGENPRGIFSVCYNRRIFAYPSAQMGRIIVHDLDNRYDIATFPAHEHDIYTMSPSFDGVLATVSQNGTILRVWETDSGTLVKEMRRGSTSANVYCVCVSDDKRFAVLHSNSGTVHVFSLCEEYKNQVGVVAGLISGMMGWVGKKENVAEYSAVTIPKIVPGVQTCVCFLPSEKCQIGLFTLSGKYIKIGLTLNTHNKTITNEDPQTIAFDLE
ncbi:WD repeat domain phosphoinositide-interacting protein, putative [Entamoeba invadens IP1]|uniref:WD repeat domain phosphoinositide-interacting protein, putative n=1 Tax=Entamoeba invadens IP1 TaxID=370355 RepID=A0A0A1U456_ENTIV|nr:WD repeat domain phosphoinositide-interacting protein, putative [Entamoeba invadens IP1]ELP88955.1 WD repeat domain phosphoinositide-interacting protein, putative [Entamoeba invadens IP1]|eukprot:XP_004255726.1 WD repeat domain phosphoinositide-interacting protein, putative [Entamoeba invadens IP1]